MIESWAAEHRLPIWNVERRYAHYLALRSLADAAEVRHRILLQGSTVAAYVFDSGRTPRDLDLLLRGRPNETIPDAERETLMHQVSVALSIGTRKYCPNFNRWQSRLRQHIRVEFFGQIMAYGVMPFAVDPTTPAATVMVLDLSSLLATKYHALFRGRRVGIRCNHPQDVFDIASLVMRNRQQIDPKALILRLQSDPRPYWSPAMSSAELFNADLNTKAQVNYDALRDLTGDHFIEFREAWSIVTDFYDAARKHL
jgi:hypothetical protein